MSDKTILVIDDSATIRKLADTHLSGAGYHVVLAPTAEDGVRLASEKHPDLILLDHQLPGTTGYEVCQSLLQVEDLRRIPVVISSTLRKKAYAEYVELDNVVDMLPKPYTGDLLLTTVANAIETAAVVVASQCQGTAVPETIQPVGESVFSGSFAAFSLREVLDFLNNGSKSGILEVEAENARIRFHLDQGRIQGVFAVGLGPEVIQSFITQLPESLAQLAPVLKMTIGGNSSHQFSGLVQLLDHKVLDPRLLRKLLRFQASMLTWFACTQNRISFRFDLSQGQQTLPADLPLDCSLLSLLVEASIHTELTDQCVRENWIYARRAIRGQNLDRAGLSARHLALMTALAQPKNDRQLADSLQWDLTEVRQVLRGFLLAELVEGGEAEESSNFLILEPDQRRAEGLKLLAEQTDKAYRGDVVRDDLTLKLLLKRKQPVAVFFSAEDAKSLRVIAELSHFLQKNSVNLPLIGFAEDLETVSMDRLLQSEQISCAGLIPLPRCSSDLTNALHLALESAANSNSEIPRRPQEETPSGSTNLLPLTATLPGDAHSPVMLEVRS
jgi:CheY-like chemotaxis protein